METSAVTLRPPIDSDAHAHANRQPSQEIHRMFGGRGDLPTPSLEHSEGWLAWMRDQDLGRIIEVDGTPVGEIRLHSWSKADHCARLAIGLWNEPHMGKGIGRQAILQILKTGFDTMELHRIDLRVLAFNQRAIRCYAACGFSHEGTLRQAVKLDEAWHDEWIMAILAPEFEQSSSRSPAQRDVISKPIGEKT